MIVCIGGLPGSGKSTVAKAIAQQLGWQFLESDDAIPNNLRQQIADGKKLSDLDLDNWILNHVIATAVELEKVSPVVVASLLARESYVTELSSSSEQSLYITLQAPYEVLKERVLARDHFATLKTLDFCWQARSEIYTSDYVIDATQSLERVTADCVGFIKTLQDNQSGRRAKRGAQPDFHTHD